MKNLIQRFIREEEGQDLIEYALLTFLVAIGLVGAITAVGDRLVTIWTQILADLS